MAERRGHGEGSVDQRARDGRWVGMVTLGGDERGKRRRQVVDGERQADVIA
jgi:integrase